MTGVATGVGSWPGDSDADHREATRVVLGELSDPPGLVYLPEVPGRGAIASMVGRSAAVVAQLGFDLQPAGFRLTGGDRATSGVDHRRAVSLLAQDLDTLTELGDGLGRGVKVQVAGPWTLAATIERPRGDKVLADHGARRELAQALAAGVADHVSDVRRRLPGAGRIVVQVDEPALPAVLGARVPTASGFSKHRSVDPQVASEQLAWVIAAVAGAGAEPWVHCCASDVPVALLQQSGARGLLTDPALLDGSRLDELGAAGEAGLAIGLGVIPSHPGPDDEVRATERALRLCDRIGLDPASDGVVVSPACGMAGAVAIQARGATRLAVKVAANLASED